MGKNRTWHREWIVNLLASTAIHSSGLIVEIKYSENGYCDLKTPNLEEWEKLQKLKMNVDDLIRHTQKLCNEGKKAYDYAKQKSNHG